MFNSNNHIIRVIELLLASIAWFDFSIVGSLFGRFLSFYHPVPTIIHSTVGEAGVRE